METKESPKRGRPKTQTKEINKTSQIGTKESETRATFIVNVVTLDKVTDIAFWERENIKDVVSSALDQYIANYQKDNGEIKPRRKKQAKQVRLIKKEAVSLIVISLFLDFILITTRG